MEGHGEAFGNQYVSYCLSIPVSFIPDLLGKVKSLGVSNFSVKTLEQLLPHCSVRPVVNQVEMHPFLPQNALKAFCDSQGILLTAYSPLGRPAGPEQAISIFNNATVKKLSEKSNIDIGQLLLSWGVQRGTVVIPKTENETRMKQNLTVRSGSVSFHPVLILFRLRF